MSFASLKLIEALLQTLQTLGYATPTPVQKQAIPAVLAGRDLMAAAQTGTGKTAAFALPVLQRLTLEGAVSAHGVRCLVLVPTRELAEQVYESFRAYGRALPLRYAVAYGGVPIEPQITRLRKGVDVLVATPGRLLDLLRQGAMTFAQLQTLVLDEADRMLDLGFAADLDALFAALPAQRQTLLFSATFSDAIRAMAKQLLSDPLSVQASAPNTAARTVRQSVYTTDKKVKPDLFLHLMEKFGWNHLLVFAKTRKGVEALVALLQSEGIAAESIHGDKAQPARLRALERFKAREVQVLVATDVAARGLDIESLPLVVNFDLPTVAEDYVHRIGRTGRAGAEGEAVSLVCADEVELLRAIETLTRQVFARQEEPGFEANHRVPSTGTPTQAATKPATKPGRARAPAAASAPPDAGRRGAGRGAPASARGAAQPSRGDAAGAPRPAGGYGALGIYEEPERKQRGGQGESGRPGNPGRTGAGQRSASGQAGRGAGAGAGSVRGAGKGNVVVVSGRGAKSAAKAAGKAERQGGGKPGPRGGKR
jgi:ATP-dependent RNA helicase RhlE